MTLEKKNQDRRREGLKGRIAVDGMLRCLSEHREDCEAPSANDEPAKTARNDG